MFHDKHVVITGGSSGVGLELARRLLARGARATLIARDAVKLARVQHELAALGAVEVERCDVSDAEATERAFRAIAERSGPTDVLINSAGVLTEGAFECQPLTEYRRLMDINFFGALHCARAVLAQMQGRGGRIVNIASLGGLVGTYGYGPYCASKFALVGLSETMRLELKPRGVSVHLVCPAEFDSPMVQELERHRSPENRGLTRMLGVMNVAAVADAILAGVARNRFQIVPGARARSFLRLHRLLPWLSFWGMDRALARLRR